MAMDYSTETATQLIPLAPGGGAGSAQRGINLKRLIRVRGPVMVAIAAVIAVPMLVAVWFVIPREYTATAALRFAHTRPTILSANQETAVASDYGQYVETNVNLIKGPAVLGMVVAKEDIRTLPLLANRPDPVYFLSNKIGVHVIPNSELVQIAFQSSDRDAAVKIVESTVQEFIKHASVAEQISTEKTTKLLEQERETLETRLQEQKTNVSQRRNNVGGVMTESGGGGVDEERKSYFDNRAKAMTDKATAESELQKLEVQQEQLTALIAANKTNPNTPIYEFGVENTVAADPAVLVQTNQLASIDVELKQVEGKYNDDHAMLKSKIETRDSVKRGLEDARKTARAKALLSLEGQTSMQIAAAQRNVEDATARVNNFDAELSEHATNSIEFAKAMSELKEAEAELENTTIMLREVKDKIRVAQVDSRAPASFSIAAPTQAPTTPDYGRRFKFMALVVMMAGGAGFAFGLYRELTDQQVRTVQDLKFITDVPMMALIPDSSVERLPKNTRPALLTAEHPESITADEFRRVLTRIIYPPEGTAELNTVLVTSASRGDGKTSLACNLAIALAQANRRVLLLDICARRPSVEKALGMKRGVGLSELFANTVSIQEAVRPAKQIDNLQVLGPGFLNAELIGKLASRETVEFLEKAEQSFEHVIIDSPPVLLMADAKLLAPVVDGVIMVVGAEVTSLGMVKRALGELQQIGSNVIGVVLNRAKHVAGGYMRDNMEKFYNYGNETTVAAGELTDEYDGDEPEVIEQEEAATMILLEDNQIRPKQKL
ncbi:MAG TPA: polysaccharide biosynthesis tyrosine autokinase [Candidatus Hydrogenedentes bacterium]|nr:polysaccharide biosynthesis tyrosine autokinase [Candidatus Hydrogenedentota bacterium]